MTVVHHLPTHTSLPAILYGEHLYVKYPCINDIKDKGLHVKDDLGLRILVKKRGLFLGLDGQLIDDSSLNCREFTGIPIVSQHKNSYGSVTCILEGFLVDNIILNPIEKLRNSIHTLYSKEAIDKFSEIRSIIEPYNGIADVPELPPNYIPNIPNPQTIKHNDN